MLGSLACVLLLVLEGLHAKRVLLLLVLQLSC